jgi:hypothetical protein
MALVGACSFDHSSVVVDAPVPDDERPDMPTTVTWAVDGKSKKGVPAAAFEWTELMNAIGLAKQPPDHLWLMQETTGILDDSVGTVLLGPQNNPTYANVVTGWSRAAVGTTAGTTEQGFITGSIGNLNGSSYLLLIYVSLAAAPPTERSLCGIGAGADHRYIAVTPTPVFKGTGNGMPGTVGMVNPMSEVHPVVLKINPAQMQYVVYTDQEKIPVTWTPTAGAGNLLTIGNAGFGGTASARYLYGALWQGTDADFADLDVKRLLLGLGWTVTGY